MISVIFKNSMYVVKDDKEALGFYSNVYDALSAASVNANGGEFSVNCTIPLGSGSSKTWYTCPKCDFPTKVTGTLNTGDYEEYSKDVYAYCPYCDVRFIIVWMQHRYLPE